MLATMPSRTLTEWMAYYEVEPFGQERADLRSGIVASTVANVFGGKGQRSKPSDFMPRFDSNKPQQSVEQMQQVFRAFASAVEKRGA